MRNLEFSGEYYGKHIAIVQVQKRTALKIFLTGGRILIQSSNFHPFGLGSQAHELYFDETCGVPKEEYFIQTVNSFKFYNCCAEAGSRVTFYKVV